MAPPGRTRITGGDGSRCRSCSQQSWASEYFAVRYFFYPLHLMQAYDAALGPPTKGQSAAPTAPPAAPPAPAPPPAPPAALAAPTPPPVSLLANLCGCKHAWRDAIRYLQCCLGWIAPHTRGLLCR